MHKQINWFNTKEQNSQEFKVHGIGILEQMQPVIVDRPSGTGDYLLMFFYEDVFIESEGRKSIYKAPTGILWDNGAGHYYGIKEYRWSHSWIHFDGAAVKKILNRSDLELNIPFKIYGLQTIEKYLGLMTDELLLNHRPNGRILLDFFEIMILEMTRLRDAENVQAVPPNLLKAKRHVELNFTRKIVLDELAKLANLSIPHFCALFKKHFGMSAIDYAIQLRMNLAAYYLRDRNRRMGEIAEMTGCKDVFYFSRIFKKKFGVSPMKFR